MYDTVSEDDLHKAAEESLTRPYPSAMYDDRLYTTHGVTFSWADRGDDLVEESNYHAALTAIRDAADEDADEHVIDAYTGHWLVGSLCQIFVQVHDDTGAYTPAFVCAVELALSLQDYPLLDDSDYSEREYERFNQNLDEAIGRAARDFDFDTDEERQAICDEAAEDFAELHGMEANGAVSWDRVEEIYIEHRDAYFTQRAMEHLAAEHDPNQSQLF